MTGTEDQLYGEFDFEAYRELGWAVTKAALAARLDLFPGPAAEAAAAAAAAAAAEATAAAAAAAAAQLSTAGTPGDGRVSGSSSP
jgi:hypothetical protein